MDTYLLAEVLPLWSLDIRSLYLDENVIKVIECLMRCFNYNFVFSPNFTKGLNTTF